MTIEKENALPDSVRVRVTPKAKAPRIVKETSEDGTDIYRVYVTAVPEDGKANQAVIEALAAYFKLPKSALTITHGLASRDKSVRIDASRRKQQK